MLTAIVGDTHGNLVQMWDMTTEWQKRTGLELECIIQVGDFGIWPAIDRLDPPTVKHALNHHYSPMKAMGDFPDVFLGEHKIPTPTYFIRGNHEDQEFLMLFEKKHEMNNPTNYMFLPIEICTNLYYIPDGYVITLGDSKVAGLGGCWGEKTWDLEYWSTVRAAQNKKGYARRLAHMTRDRFEMLMKQDFDVLITHDVPTGAGVHGMSNPKESNLDPESISENSPEGVGVHQIRQLIEKKKPKYHFNGHWHEFKRNRFGNTDAYVLDKVHPDGKDRRCMEIIKL